MCARARRLRSDGRRFALAAVAGGAMMATGAFLPWLTLFAGLHPLRGVIGLNGRVLAAGGAVCLVAGIRGWLRPAPWGRDRKSTRLNSSHRCISYAVFRLKKKKHSDTVFEADC